jgi:hypothetical protein
LQIHRYFLYSLGLLLVAAAHFYFLQDLWQISVLLGFVVFVCFYRGLRSQRRNLGLKALDYRTGDALEKTHRYRRHLGELLALHARVSSSPVTFAQLDAADKKGKSQILARVYREAVQSTTDKALAKEAGATLHEVNGKDRQPKPWWLPRSANEKKAEAEASDLCFCQRLAEDYFEVNAFKLKSRIGRSYLESDLSAKHMPLRENLHWLSKLTQQLAAELESGGKK